MTAQLEPANDPYGDVETRLLFEPPLPPPWDDLIHRQLYDGVHAGLAVNDEPLPLGGVLILITELRIVPPLAPDAGEAEVRSVVQTVHAVTAATVAALWTRSVLPVAANG